MESGCPMSGNVQLEIGLFGITTALVAYLWLGFKIEKIIFKIKLLDYCKFLCPINRHNYFKTSKGSKYRNSALHCKEFCEETDGCGAWSFETSTKICTTRESAGYAIDKEILHYLFIKKVRKTIYFYL